MVTHSPRTFSYIRASKKTQQLSPEAQRATIARFLACRTQMDQAFGRQPIPPLTREFVDALKHARSGTLRFAERPSGAELLAEVRLGDHVVVAKVDRLGRRALDILASVEALEERGAIVHLLNFGGAMEIDTSTPAGRLFLTQLAGFAEFERALIGERTKAALDANRRNGKPSTIAPTGMRIETTYRGRHTEKRYVWDSRKVAWMMMAVDFVDNRGLNFAEAAEEMNKVQCLEEERPYVKGNMRNLWDRKNARYYYLAGKRKQAGRCPVKERAERVP